MARAPRAAPRPGTPVVSVVIPAFNRPGLLAQALASIAAQTTHLPVEVIVSDDMGLEATRDVVARYGDRGYLYTRNPEPRGAVANWNRCLRLATSDYVTLLHEDDALYPWFLETALPHLGDGAAAVCTRTTRGPVMPVIQQPRPRARVDQYRPGYFLKSSMTPFPGVVMRREVALGLGGFDEAWGPIADYEFWYRLACSGEVRIVHADAAFYRVAPNQWTERVWPRMLRLTHLLRLRIAREQFPEWPGAALWAARLFTLRNTRSYAERFGSAAPVVGRCRRLSRMPLSSFPSGWLWGALKFASLPEGRYCRLAPNARPAAQIQQGGGGSDFVAA
ncbi:MAG TPA: glycosyltransferase family 2 protein [Opitutaceae bacterium]|jgi:glycosyltransferase involved in cell wall biosynthesis